MTNKAESNEEDSANSSDRLKYILTFGIYYCSFTFGIAFTFLSPIVIDFSNKFDSDVKEVSVVFTIITGAYLCGAFGAGVTLRLFRRQFVVIFLLSCMCVSLYTIPHLPTLILFLVFSFVLGFGSGGYEACHVAWVIDIWRHKSEPFILSQHFAYSIGTVVPPLLLGPFLKGENSTVTTTTPSITTTESYPSSTSSSIVPEGGSKLFVPFTAAASLVLAGIVVQLILIVKLSNPSNGDQVDLNEKQEDVPHGDNSQKRNVLLTILSCCVISAYQGCELTTMQFMPTFAVFCELKLSESEGANILFGLTLAFAICRGIGILLILKIRPEYLLCGNFMFLFFGNVVLLWLAQTSKIWLWIGACMMGIGASTLYGGFYAFIQRHLHVTNTTAATVAVSGGLVAAIEPLIVGNAVEKNPSILCYVNFVSIAMLVASFSVTYWFTMIRENGDKKNEKV